jgi:phosphohistidine phosphatase SixA
MIVGHNPTMEELVRALTGSAKDMPSGTLANIHLRVDEWAGVREYELGALLNFWRPREVSLKLEALAEGA